MNVSFTSEMTDWGEEESKRVGCSLATFIRKRKTGAAAVAAWQSNYTQLEILFTEVIGFETFMLQLYVWLVNPEQAGTFALASIGISVLTTGFTSATIAFNMDVDVPHRKNQPKFYGYIPGDNGLRGRCFALMTLINT